MALVDAIWLFPDLWKITLPLSGSAPAPTTIEVILVLAVPVKNYVTKM